MPLKTKKPSQEIVIKLAYNIYGFGEHLSSWGPQNILKFLNLPGSDFTYLPGKAAGNPVSKGPGCFPQGLHDFIKSILYP